MIPSVVTTQLQAILRDYLRTTFSIRDRAYERALLDFLGDPEEGLFRGPYVDLRLPFRRGRNADANLEVRPSFDPYTHQIRAWERLGSAEGRPRSTIVATGTGSGKTECFLYPLLDHCLRNRHQPGIKAIILYPMNALASDQAERFAREIHTWPSPAAPRLRGKIRAGLYVGGKGSHPVPDERHLEDMREHLRRSPPDILLTNYRMLDFLLLRPEDSVLWAKNGPETLQYLVLDELHTYDGAQGTDVAFLIRRLKRRLGIPDGHLCCVGTSATIGGDAGQGRDALLRFAGDVFGEPFEGGAIITEDRLTVREALATSDAPESFPDALRAPTAVLSADTHAGPRAFLEAQAQLWLGPPPAGRDEWIRGSAEDPEAVDLEDDEGRVLLGAQLLQHPFLRDVLAAQSARGSGPCAWQDLVAALPEDTEIDDRSPGDQWLILASFLALVAHARRREGGRVIPFLTLQVQLWLRELRRLLRKVPRSVDEAPEFAWFDTLEEAENTRYATQVHCNECGDIGLGFVQVEGKRELIAAPERVGEAYLRGTDTARYVRLGHHAFGEGGQGRLGRTYLCPATLDLDVSDEPLARDIDRDGVSTPIARVPVDVSADLSEEGRRFLRRCPVCGVDDGLTILGSRAASLSSVAISHLFISPYNSDRKLLAFTDSVQDASHRAGFFAGRTFRFVLRTAMQATLEARPEDQPMAGFVDALLDHWRSRLEGSEGHQGRLAATLLPPDLRDDPDYRAFIDALANPKRRGTKERKAVDALLRLRLSWEIAREFGLGIVVGRSLDRTACATATPDPNALAAAAKGLHAWLHETRPVALRGGGPSLAEVTHFLEGLVERLRSRGGVHDPLLDTYVRHGSRFFLSRRKNPRISRFGERARFPLFAFHGATHRVFEPLYAPPARVTWYRDWTSRALGVETRDGGINDVLGNALRRLADAGLVETRTTKGPAKSEPRASGLAPAKLWLTRAVSVVGCATCGNFRTIADAARTRWVGARCPTYRCVGVMQATALGDEHGYYRRIYKGGRIHRVFTAEHTGLLARQDREELEADFKRGTRPDAPNLLTCTPTLEMGIDIGDLSAVMLCSVPPLPANYVQRVGRAGRSTGNALVLTIANARPHDRYFFEQPEQMMRGQIDPPACFLDAPDMLARQLVAHALDSWASKADDQKIPRRMGDLLGPANRDGFPHSFFAFYAANKAAIARDFFAAFGRDAALHPAWVEITRSLQAMIDGDLVIAKIRAAFDGVEVERAELRRRRDALRRRKAELLEDPGKAHPHVDEPERSAEHELKDLEQAERSYGAQLTALSEKYPLNVLTDAGVLPNYAFPEPGVTLRATLLGLPAPGKEDDAGSPAKRARGAERAEYIRPASAAIREFAPFNSFYAEGRRIEITQLDLGSRQAPTIEPWRLCAACNHAERERLDQPPAKTCPRCDDGRWGDQGQIRPLIEFRKAWSTSSILEASTADETDEREQERYKLVSLIEVVDGAQTGEARLIDAGDVVFGYELLPRAILREINFGRDHDTGITASIAGESVSQAGFVVCTLCGRVQAQSGPAQPARHEHLPWCRVRTAGASEDFVQVGLYRHNISEAIRVLLPVADHDVARVVNSVRAGLELGFRRKFGGQPLHLRVTTMSEPAGQSRQRFLVIYDTVPGGTGYLAELWRQGELFTVMELALDAMKRCRCVAQESRDGCYRCVYAHQHQRELPSISRKRAVELFEAILSRRDHLKTVPSLADVNLDSLLESELERRFVAALRRAAEERGWRWSETAFGGRQGFRMVVSDDLAWELRPQVTVGPADGVDGHTRPDFVLVPVGRKVRKIAVYTDGFEFHAQPGRERGRIADDIAKRGALLDTSESAPPSERFWVWSLTWTDVASALKESGAVGVDALLRDVPPRSFQQVAASVIAGSPGASAPRRELGGSESFELLIHFLADPDEDAMRRLAITLGIAGLDLTRRVRAPAVEALRDTLAAGTQRPSDALPSEPNGTELASLRQRPFVVLLLNTASKRLTNRDFGVRAQLRLYDLAEEREAEGFEASWRSFLQAWNLLQFHDVAVQSSEHLLASGELEGSPGSVLPLADEAQSLETRPLRADLAALLDDFAEFEPILRLLGERGLPAPTEPELDLILDGARVDVDLVWEDARVALLTALDDHERQRFAVADWLAFDPTADDLAAIADALAQRSSR